MIGGHELSYTLAIVAFLIGTALGVSVARRRIIQLRAAANEPKSGATDVVVSPATVDEIVIAALDSLPSGVVIAGADGTVLFKNTAAKSISGVRHIDVLVDEAVESMVATAVTNEAQHRRFETAGSPSRAFDIRTKRLANGRIVATVEDVTEQSRIDTVRTDFVANLSHELKTPIGGIAALADTMSGETDPAVIERLTARIVDESYRLSRIVDDLLDLSRIEFGGADDWEPVTVTDVVNEVVARMQHEAKRAGVAIDAKCVAGVRVVGDRMQLVSALQNLVSNAIKYSGDGKKVQVEVQATPELVSIIVVDQGIGIAAKDHQRIFERFYRVDRARSRATGGSGLGLSIVRHVVSNHGGTVTVVSEEGRGSTFTIVLPRAESSAESIGPVESTQQSQSEVVVSREPRIPDGKVDTNRSVATSNETDVSV
ncbi:MAG: two-component sensor histidine kinase [Actinobacteria bacterium]|nr:two-component sensor histidine kinase [Actinomycetota bacterium]NDG10485.1 two-component sensor histidine kinase [Actinomycetota bacterium]